MVLVGLALCILPGVYMGTRFLLAGFCLISTEAGVRSAFQRSAILSQGGEWELFILVLLIVGLNLVGASLVGRGPLVTVPISTLAMASAFRQLVGTASPSFCKSMWRTGTLGG